MVGTARRAFAHPTRSRPGMTGLQIHHHVIAFDGDFDGLRDIWALHHGGAWLDIDGIGLHAEAAGIAIGLAGADVELPAMPGAADDLAEPGVFDRAGIGGLREPDQRTFAQRRAL